MPFLGWVTMVLLSAPPAAGALPELRREPAADFAFDEAFLTGGGVQYFFELAAPGAAASPGSTLAHFRDFDAKRGAGDGLHVVMSRIVYDVQRDATFFDEARARDVTYMRDVAPEAGVRLEPDGTYWATRTPAHRFRVRFFDAEAAARVPREPGLARLLAVLPPGSTPASVICQENFDFSRMLGARTADRAVTWTAHLPLGPGRTRIVVYTMSFLVNLPPFFLGGGQRVYDESVQGAARLIRNLRVWPARPAPR